MMTIKDGNLGIEIQVYSHNNTLLKLPHERKIIRFPKEFTSNCNLICEKIFKTS